MKAASLFAIASAALVGSSVVEAKNFRSLANTCAWTCNTQCAKCTVTTLVDAATKSVTINVGGCKGSKISWMCCKDTPGCALKSCDGKAGSGSQCDDVTSSVYTVPVGATTMCLQMHDGQLAGDVDCSGRGMCCGGAKSSCGTIFGVCNIKVDLSTCTGTTPAPTTTTPTTATPTTPTTTAAVSRRLARARSAESLLVVGTLFVSVQSSQRINTNTHHIVLVE